MDRINLKKYLLFPILLSVCLLVTYYLKSNGFPSVLIFLSVVFTAALFRFFSTRKVDSYDVCLSALFFFHASLPLASRGPSLNNLLFLISFSALFSYFLEERKNQNMPALLFLAPVFSVWAIVGNWEFPSVFNPFVIYGKRELSFLSAAIALAAGKVTSTKKRLLLVLLALALLFPAADLYISSEIIAFRELKNFSIESAVAVLILSIFSVLFWLEIERNAESRALVLYQTLILTPVMLTAFSWLQHLIRPLLPIPFEPGTIGYSLVFSFALYLLGFNEVVQSSKPFFFFAGILFFLRIFAPAELNVYDYGGIRYSNYSLGFEHLGPLFFVWIFALLGSSNFIKTRSLLLLLASAFFVTRLYFTRLYHFSKTAPVEFFKDLGSEGVSWIRQPVVAAEPFYMLLIAVIICSAYMAFTGTFLRRT